MLNTKKSIRFLTVFTLVFAMAISIVSIPVSAAGVETWYASKVTEPTFNMYGTNLTPVKTMGVSGNLGLTANFVLTDTNTYSELAICTVEIRSLDGTVLTSNTGVAFYSNVSVSVRLPVTVNEQIQVYMTVYNVNSTTKRSADVTYSHYIN